MGDLMKKLFLFICLFLLFTKVNAEIVDLAPHAKTAILVENTTGKILYEKGKDTKMSPASMTKIMTLLLTMEALESGKITLDDKVTISKKASGMGGTQIFVKEGSKVDVLTLIKGIAIASANDAAVAIAEYIGGTLDSFVAMMNEKANKLGCNNTSFKNPHGLDEKDHYTTAYDLSLIARELLKYPFALKITSTYEDYIKVSGENHWLVNTNKLIRFYTGIDGLKTGYTDNAGYCLTATMEKNNMRLISIVMKEDSKENRNNDTISMLEYGFANYGSENVLNKNKFKESMIIDNAYNRKVNYYLNSDVNIITNKGKKNVNYTIDKVLYNVKAPLKKNDKVGVIKLRYDGKVYNYDLIVKENVKRVTFGKLFNNIFYDIVSGFSFK